MFYLIDEEGELLHADTLNALMKLADEEQRAYGDMRDWMIFQGTKIEVERSYIVKNPPKPILKKVVAKKPAVKKVTK